MRRPPSHRVVIADPLAPDGPGRLREAGCAVVDATGLDRHGLTAALAGADALVVRSRTRVDPKLLDAGERLRVVARAGVGIDNIAVDEATRRGILVVNVPSGNLLSAAEHTFALLLALARNVDSASHSLAAGAWHRDRFVGTELHAKTLGIVGLGRIGRKVAVRARAFGMKIVAHDPHLDREVAAELGIPLLGLDDVLRRADVITLHVPLDEGTRGFLGADELRRMRPGGLLVNCARGGLVDEDALLESLESGHLGGAALDVFAEEPPGDHTPGRALIRHPRVVATPHLGAQTHEAKRRVSARVARIVLDALDGSPAVPAVNLPFAWDEEWDPRYLGLAETLGRLSAALFGAAARTVELGVCGIEDGLERPLALAAGRGVLASSLGLAASYVDVERLLAERGIRLELGSCPPWGRERPGHDALVSVTVGDGAGGEPIDAAGTLTHGSRPRVVRFGGAPIELSPDGRLLVIRSSDQPGLVGSIGTLLGEAAVNIADAHLGRERSADDAWTVLRLDQNPDDETL
ncbi:MAG: phosphoglycerate dehydrogenase, partial [Acidobacteriota bacterium]